MKRLILALLITLLASCSTTHDPADAYKGEEPDKIFTQGEHELRDRNYQEAIKRFEALDVQYPFYVHTEIAQLHLIYAYYMNTDYQLSETAATRYIHAHPTSQNVDYAYFLRGLATYYQKLGVFEKLFSVDLATRDLVQIKKSYEDFHRIETDYPQSVYAPAAHQYVIYLRNTIAAHSLEIAKFYFKRGAYVAAINRASDVVKYFDGTPSVPDALAILVEANRKLQLDKNADEALKVLEYNYPNAMRNVKLYD